MHLRQPTFTYSACGSFKKNKERIQMFTEIGDSRYIYQNELDKDMAYGYFKILIRRTASDKMLRDKAFNIAKNPKYDGYKGVLLQWYIIFSIIKLQAEQLKMKIFLTKN